MRGRDPRSIKAEVRERVWRLLEERGVARFPLPVKGRIPNFAGAEEAAARLRSSDEYQAARVVKVNPDSPQRPVRLMALQDGKLLVMPTPRIRSGFLLLDPSRIPKGMVSQASTISGAFRLGLQVHPRDLPRIDLIVIGSVAVTPSGWRVGKGEGYAELEYGILRSFGKVDGSTPIFTTVHELQLVEDLPREPFDVPVDAIFTERRAIRCPPNPKPEGIYWELLDERKLEEIPLLQEMRRTFYRRELL
ncbi:MAG: 5-formyltetrahydrofolate cyclo-ligase [Nitrososphaerota archaeon]|nr:5-formyltetrahydrofolate cyclo-ligase [Candidatus Calditenuis fumarioli]